MTLSATKARGGRPATHTRDTIIQALRDYAEAYGPDFTTAAFNPSVAKWRDDSESRERYLRGNPKTGEPWPSLNTIKSFFDGSFNDARVAAGLQPNTPGPSKNGKRPAHKHAPVRGVSDTYRRFVEKVPDEAAVERVRRELGRELAKAERRAEKAEKALASAKARVVRERVVDTAALDRAREARDEARKTATRLAARLERAEATITDLRDERRMSRAENARLRKLAEAAENKVTEVEVERVVEVPVEVEVVREVVKKVPVEKIVERPHPGETAIAEARDDARQARAAARAAERRAAEAERRHVELAEAVRGERRVLSSDEIRELKAKGPAGPAILAAALKELAKARSGNGDVGMALLRVASAAVSWRSRL